MSWPVRQVLLIPAVDWMHYARRFLSPDRRQPAPRLAASLSFLLRELKRYADTATVGFFGETLSAHADLVQLTLDTGCEIAVMTEKTIDPFSLAPSLFATELKNTIAAAQAINLPSPTRFMPPFPANQQLSAEQIKTLKEHGIQQTLGCGGEGLPAIWLGAWAGNPLTGSTVRWLPNFLLRRALNHPPAVALCLTPMDIDPGAPGCGSGRQHCLNKLPGLLGRGFVSAAQYR